jgi:hypothetical protein
LKRRGGRDAHGGLVGDWNREKHMKSAQVDYMREDGGKRCRSRGVVVAVV